MLNSKRSEGSLARAAATAMLMILGIGVGLGIGEGFARLTYNTPWYERLLGEQFAKIHPALNHYGLRDQETSPLKPPDQRRILVLGDSFTYGEGVPDDKAVFPDLLEAGLNRDRPLPGVERYDVLNAGITGSLTRDWLGVWEEVTPEYKPDALLIVFFLRDGTRSGSIPDFFGKIRDEILTRNRRSYFYAHSYLYRMIRDGFDRKRVGRDYTRKFLDSYFGNEAATEEWRQAQANLLRLRDLAREKNIPVGLVVFPILIELDDSYPFLPICQALDDFASRNGIPVHDLLADFLGKDGTSLWVSAFDQHPNAEGHRIAAASILPFVEELLRKSSPVHRG